PGHARVADRLTLGDRAVAAYEVVEVRVVVGVAVARVQVDGVAARTLVGDVVDPAALHRPHRPPDRHHHVDAVVPAGPPRPERVGVHRAVHGADEAGDPP